MDSERKQQLQEELTRERFKPSTPVKAEYNDSHGKVSCFGGMVKDYQPDYLELLLEEELTVKIREGCQLILILGDPKTVLVHYYCSQILAISTGNPQTLRLSVPHEISVSSLRCFFRCDITVPFWYIVENVLEFEGQTKNLSAGGLLGVVKFDSTLIVDTLVDIRISLPDFPGPLIVPSQILRIEKAPKSNMQIGVKFLKISEIQQNQIIKYLFQCEREMKSKRAMY